MGYKRDITIDEVFIVLETRGKTEIRESDANEASYKALLAAQDGETNLAWGRRLFELADTGNVTMTVDASSKTIEGVSGHAIFADFKAGRDVQLNNFTNAGNNQTTEITSVVNPDKIHVNSATGLIDETDNNPRAQENPTSPELDVVADVIEAMNALHNLHLAHTQDVSSADRRGDLEAFVI